MTDMPPTDGHRTTFAEIGRFFDRLLAEHGPTHLASDYGSEESRTRRFAVLSAAGDLSGRRVLDVGCGLAPLADFLAARHGHVDYDGVDLSAQTIATARQLRPHLDLRAGNVLDVDERFDVVIANGVFYLLGDEAPALMRRIVRHMWGLARELVVFSSLSTWAPAGVENEYRADPLETLAWCRELSPLVALRHDYLPHDFTIYLRREPHA
jgi:SAM-dependent methyltransferase